jgi:hypothetical protein
MKALIRPQDVYGSSNFERSYAIEDAKELHCSLVQMASFRRATWQTLSNHTHIWGCCEVPAVGFTAPNVMLSCLY